MHFPVSLLQYYVRNPSRVLRHVNSAVRILVTQGPSGLRERARMVADVANGGIGASGEGRRQRDLLKAMAESSSRNRDAILATLLPHAADLMVLDVVHDPALRSKLVRSHLLRKLHLFDEAYYGSTYLTGEHTITPLDHYMQFGFAGGARPNPFFDPAEYLSAYPDVAEFGIDPVLHYALFGWKEGRSAGSLFDGNFYVESNPDVLTSGLSPLHHFLAFGRAEGRSPTRLGASGGSAGFTRSRGTILLVSHDAELGGAQQVIRVFARWLIAATNYDVKFVTVKSGAFAQSFREIADTFDMGTETADDELGMRLDRWAGPDVKAVFMNSAASGRFLEHWTRDVPILAFIHELPKLLHILSHEVDLIRARASMVIGGSDAVRTALRDEFGFDRDRLGMVYGFIEEPERDELVDRDDKRNAKVLLGLDPDAFVVAGCGVLHWRKSPDKFIEVAEKVIAARPDAQFIWIGGGPDQEACEALIAEKGLGASVRITGYEPDIKRWLKAADLFLLPSEEDPFPLVCLYAATALAPIVCFEKAGGMPEFVRKGCGKAVPFMDVEAMAGAVLDYATDREALERDGDMGRALVLGGYTVATTGPQLLHAIRSTAGLKPQASVVVPNYNYERFLGQRLESIARQTFQDFEVILLDDMSRDGSVSVLEAWARQRPGTRVVVNETNSGSPFAQWMRGMRMAESDLIWIAEADDFCEPELLATLLPRFENRNVFLGYVKSVPVNVDGDVSGDYEPLYLNRINEGRWKRSYLATDADEARDGLGRANCIPNASSVVFRRFDPEPEFEQAVTGMRLCGDWYFYLRAMRGGLVAYDAAPLNMHRRHDSTVTSTTEGQGRYFDEFAVVRSYVASNWRLGTEALDRIRRFTVEDLDRFGVTDEVRRKRILDQALSAETDKAMPSILVAVSDLSPGGGQMFGIRLANGWVRRGGRAVLLNARHFEDHPKVVQQVDRNVVLINADDMSGSFSELVRRFDIDLVHSSIWWADRWTQDHIGSTPDLPWVVTMHGCHETMLDEPSVDVSFPDRFRRMLGRVSGWVYLSQKNQRVFTRYGAPEQLVQVANGIPRPPELPVRTRAELGIRDGALVLGLVSRAIEDKGWLVAADAVKQLNASGLKTDLVLLGEGPAADELRNNPVDGVHVFGHVADVHSYLHACDIGILPTFFAGESMPLVLIEMMAMGMPLIASDIGEIAAMIGREGDAAGIVLPLRNGKVDAAALANAVRDLADPERRRVFGANALARYERAYTMEAMLDAYHTVYRQAIDEERGAKKEQLVVA